MTTTYLAKNERQKERELSALSVSYARTQKMIAQARERGKETQLSTVQSLLKHQIKGLLGPIQKYIRDVRSCRVQIPYLSLLETLSDTEIATIVLLRTLRTISTPTPIYKLATNIADALIIEAELSYTYVTEPHKRKSMVNNLTRKQRGAKYKQLKEYRYTTQVRKSITQSFALELKYRAKLGNDLIGLLASSLAVIVLEKRKYMCNKHAITYVIAHDDVRAFLSKSRNMNCLSFLTRKLMIAKPLPHARYKRGGYHVRTAPYYDALVKTGDSHYRADVSSQHMPKIYTAINVLQDVPLRINKKVFSVLETLYNSRSRLANLPDQECGVQQLDTEELRTLDSREYACRVRSFEEYKNAHLGKHIALARTVNEAKELLNETELYTPYQLDFRSRVYACAELNYQCDDISKAILQFAESSQLTERGVFWLAIHGANVAGYDKVSFTERVRWIESHTQLIVACAVDPLNCTAWQSMIGDVHIDKPWLFLAFCFEWANYKQYGLDYCTHLPVSLDASCNGIQHCALMLRDPTTARLANLDVSTADDKPYDTYNIIAKVVNTKLRDYTIKGTDDCIDINKTTNKEYTKFGTRNLAQRWIRFGVTRKTIKRPVMTLGYGATLRGFGDQLRDNIITVERVKSYDKYNKSNYVFTEHGTQDANFLAHIIWDVATTELRAVKVTRDFLQRCTAVLNKYKKHTTWVTPLNFKVKQSYSDFELKRVSLKLENTKQQICYPNYKDNPRSFKQLNSIAPNFTHSYDATHLFNVINSLAQGGITNILTVHDCIAVAPSNVDALHTTVKKEFVKLYSANNDPLLSFYNDIKELLPIEAHNKLPPLPTRGSFDVNNVHASMYCFS